MHSDERGGRGALVRGACFSWLCHSLRLGLHCPDKAAARDGRLVTLPNLRPPHPPTPLPPTAPHPSDSAMPLFERDLRALDASISDLERTHAALRTQLASERQAAEQLGRLLAPAGAAAAQAARADAMARGMPARLPTLPGAEALLRALPRAPILPPMPAAAAKAAAGRRRWPEGDSGRDDHDHDDDRDDDDTRAAEPAPPPLPAAPTPAAAPMRPPTLTAPRWYVTQAELSQAPSYLRGPRLTLERVNAAVDEAAALAEGTARLMAAARAGALARFVPDPEERRRAADMYHSVHARLEMGLRGRPWFLGDLRGAPPGAALRPDKSGRALLQLLRHLGRVQEQRLSLETAGGACSAFVLLVEGGGGGRGGVGAAAWGGAARR
jgi:hypothetical protein